MRYTHRGFTLIELTISILILSVVIIGISLSLVKISDNFVDSDLKTIIFSDIKDFSYDSYLFKYNAGKILTGGLLLYGSGNGVFLGTFEDVQGGFDYELYSDTATYQPAYFGYFILKSNILSGVLNNTLDLTSYKFNDGKIYKNLVVKKIDIFSYNAGRIFQIDLEIFKKYSTDYTGVAKNQLQILSEDYLKFNFNF